MFDRTVENPDSLADHPKIARLAGTRLTDWANDDFPHMEDLIAVFEMAYARVLVKLGPKLSGGLPFPDGLDSSPREVLVGARPHDADSEQPERKYPRLFRLFG